MNSSNINREQNLTHLGAEGREGNKKVVLNFYLGTFFLFILIA